MQHAVNAQKFNEDEPNVTWHDETLWLSLIHI